MNRASLQRKLAELERLYATLPAIDCQRKCQECCGPIILSKIEDERIERQTRISLTMASLEVMQTEEMKCPMLKNGACSIYKIRPLACRLWGLVEKMRCPFGCVPERWVSDAEAHRLMKRIDQLLPAF